MSPRADGKDGHLLKTLGGIRLDNADDDAWIRAYAKKTDQSVRKIVIRAIRELRERIENGGINDRRD